MERRKERYLRKRKIFLPDSGAWRIGPSSNFERSQPHTTSTNPSAIPFGLRVKGRDVERWLMAGVNGALAS